ncbi:MAG: tRNA (cytidine(34)-2'-O)-methyltransferase [Actinomycetaceae bacterium]|nr:tRNA (cytidine(34)-2'-O)-methyltransferase [Actinomycetaceae bacterium]MDU0969582.1 tRNA (cytidine(34)-2'-O)-methyltransferase [Actinomycetaceae bacterium]
MLHLLYYAPCIPGNAGAAIRLSACTGSMLHLIEPLGFDMDDTKLKRAGLDYHDLAHVKVHPTLDDALAEVPGALYAFTGHSSTSFASISYADGDGLLFGPEPTGLPQEVLDDPRVTAKVRIPMTPHRRSLNLTISASIAVYEALRQLDYPGLV